MYTVLPNTLDVTWQGMIFIFNILMNPLQYATPPPLPNVVWLFHTLFKYTTINCNKEYYDFKKKSNLGPMTSRL